MAERESDRAKKAMNPKGLGGPTHKRKEEPMAIAPEPRKNECAYFNEHRAEILAESAQMGAAAAARKHNIAPWRIWQAKDKPGKKLTGIPNLDATGPKPVNPPVGLQPPASMTPPERQLWNQQHQVELVELVKTAPYRELIVKWRLSSSTIGRLRRLAGFPKRQYPGKSSPEVHIPEFPAFSECGSDPVRVAWLGAYAQMALGAKG